MNFSTHTHLNLGWPPLQRGVEQFECCDVPRRDGAESGGLCSGDPDWHPVMSVCVMSVRVCV